MRPWLEVLNLNIESQLGTIKHALLDFDGTISVIRQGWEDVMVPLMIEMICNGEPSTTEIEKIVREYVDYSTGILTIKQMQWLADAVRQYGLSKNPKSANEYKRVYNQRLLVRVEERLKRLTNSDMCPDDLMIVGSKNFIQQLKQRNVMLYLVSGTDHEDVLREAAALKITEYFGDKIYGALDNTEANDKEKIIQRILNENSLRGNELLVVGDGPVEIRNAKSKDAIALGVATDEIKRYGLNYYKRKRLITAGVDLLISDFRRADELILYLWRE